MLRQLPCNGRQGCKNLIKVDYMEGDENEVVCDECELLGAAVEAAMYLKQSDWGPVRERFLNV